MLGELGGHDSQVRILPAIEPELRELIELAWLGRPDQVCTGHRRLGLDRRF
jgi:hypothetical protein